MRIKTKVTLGVVFLFGVILGVGGIALYYLNELSIDSKNIIRNNYETLEYTKRILTALENDPPGARDTIEVNLQRQEANITEPGEGEETQALRNAFEKLRHEPADSLARTSLRQAALKIQDLNLKAIITKNEIAQTTARNASTYVIIIVSVIAIIAFSFIVNFPGYIADPIIQLTNSIKLIANKDYEERLRFSRKDEFGELAEAFNQMAEKLDEYEHSNLSKLIFEKKRIEAIINRMTDPVIGLDDSKRIVFANEEALTLLSMSSENVVGRYAPDVAVENDLMRTLIRGENEPKDLLKIVLNGKENYFEREIITIRYHPTGEKQNVQIGQVIMMKNVTPYKELDLAKTNFMATISHELKTPIASLQMCTKLLQDERIGKLNEEQNRIVKTLGDEISRLSKITMELIDLAQLETGNIKLNLQPVDPNDIILQALEAVKFQAERKSVTVKNHPDKELSMVRADSDKATWVLVNLLTNAIRYSPENGEVMLQTKSNNGYVVIRVQDFGPGIEAKFLNRLFEKFFQVPGTPSGSGLGLAISKEFIEAQGGTLEVESEVGKGSTFSFTLLKAS